MQWKGPLKSALTRFADMLESLSRRAVEEPFAVDGKDAGDLVREILKRMETAKVELLDGIYVPDYYLLKVPTSLYQRYQDYLGQQLCAQIAAEIHLQIDRWDYEVQSPVKVELRDGGHENRRRIEIESAFREEDAHRGSQYCTIASDDPIEHLRQAQQLQTEKRFEEAVVEFEAALRLNPGISAAYFNLGAIHFQQHRYREAARSYRRGLELNPDQMTVHADVAKAYEMLGEWDRALAHLDIAIALQPGHPVVQRRAQRIREEREVYATLRTHVEATFIKPNARAKSERTRSRHFFIYSTKSFPALKLRSLEEMLESIYDELSDRFQTYPEQRIEVRIQPSRSDSARMPSWAAALYDGRIHLVWNTSHPVELAMAYVLLRHEFTHVLVEQLTHKNCPLWLSEGLAEFHARKLMVAEEQMLRKAVHQSRAIPFAQLERGFQKLESRQIRLAYVQSCSMVGYLVERFQMTHMVQLLRVLGEKQSWPKAVEQCFHVPHHALEKHWLESIRRQRP